MKKRASTMRWFDLRGILIPTFFVFAALFFSTPANAATAINVLINDEHGFLNNTQHDDHTITLSDTAAYVVIISQSDGSSMRPSLNCQQTGGSYGWLYLNPAAAGNDLTNCINEYAGMSYVLAPNIPYPDYEMFILDVRNRATSTMILRNYSDGSNGYYSWSVYEILATEDDLIFDYEEAAAYNSTITATPFASSSSALTSYVFAGYTGYNGTNILYDWNESTVDYYEAIQSITNYRDSTAGAFLIPSFINSFLLAPTQNTIYRMNVLLISMETPVSAPVIAPVIEEYGLFLPEYYNCCFGNCSTLITMPPQLGWWGVGDVTTRIIDYSIGTSSYQLDFTNMPSAPLVIPDDLAVGFYDLEYSLVISGIRSASSTAHIQIIADEACRSTSELDFLAYCEEPCAGIATSTNPLDLDNFICGLREIGCWLTLPDQTQLANLAFQWQIFLHRFPLAPITKIYDDVKLAASSSDDSIQSGYLAFPVAQSGHLGIKYHNVASTSLMQSEGWHKFRYHFQKIAMWCVGGAIPIVLIILALIL